MNHYGDKNIKNLRKYDIILTIVTLLVLLSIAIIIITDGFISFILLLAQSLMLTTFYELFKATIDKTNRIYEIYKDYYERTLLNETTLDILELQILEILSSKKIDISSLLFYIDNYYSHLNNNEFYNDDTLAKANKLIKDFIASFKSAKSNKSKKELTLKLLADLRTINDEAQNYLKKYYLKSKEIYDH